MEYPFADQKHLILIVVMRGMRNSAPGEVRSAPADRESGVRPARENRTLALWPSV